MATRATKAAEFTAWVIRVMDNWPGPKDQKKRVIDLLYDAYTQGRIVGMDAPVNAMRQCIQAYDAMVANSGVFKAKLVRQVEEVLVLRKHDFNPAPGNLLGLKCNHCNVMYATEEHKDVYCTPEP